MTVEIWSDVVCPFCFIGKRRFEQALARFDGNVAINVVWKSFQLNPGAVTNPGINVLDDLARTKGWTKDYTLKTTEYVVQMAKGEGLNFNFEKAVVANTFNAHRLLQLAKSNGLGEQVKENLLHAYFEQGKNVDDAATLIHMGVEAGLHKPEVARLFENTGLFADAVRADLNEARQLGISGVPFFVINRKYALSGAQPVSVMLETLQKASQDHMKLA